MLRSSPGLRSGTVILEDTLAPRPPYSLALSTRMRSDATRRFRDGVSRLGRFERGLVGDLGLIKLCAALRGRRADAQDTRELLEPYGEWTGLAGVYLLAGFPKRTFRGSGLPERREKDHVADRLPSRQEHDEPVEPQPETAGSRPS
jgi:hypothetical protein